jgi:hypothetical protein
MLSDRHCGGGSADRKLARPRKEDKVKISFVRFDEVDKSSDALRNLFPDILDKATLTLDDNRRVPGVHVGSAARAWSGSISVFRSWAQRLRAGSSFPGSSTGLKDRGVQISGDRGIHVAGGGEWGSFCNQFA